MTPDRLVLVSCMAPLADGLYAHVAEHLSRATGLEVEVAHDAPWEQRMAMLDGGGAHLGHVCGPQFLARAGAFEPLAAPVPAGARYAAPAAATHGNAAVYYSDLVVRADSRWDRLEEMRGARWAYNEPTSFSGFGAMAFALAQRGLGWDHFGTVVEAGSHERAIELLLAGEVDGAAIDSTVLDVAGLASPGLDARLRVIDSVGPSPSPPLIVSRALPAPLTLRLREAVTSMHRDAAGRQALEAVLLERFDAVEAADYEPIRRMAAVAAAAGTATVAASA